MCQALSSGSDTHFNLCIMGRDPSIVPSLECLFIIIECCYITLIFIFSKQRDCYFLFKITTHALHENKSTWLTWYKKYKKFIGQIQNCKSLIHKLNRLLSNEFAVIIVFKLLVQIFFKKKLLVQIKSINTSWFTGKHKKMWDILR